MGPWTVFWDYCDEVGMVSWHTRVPSWGGRGLLWRQLQWGIRNPLCPVLGTWSQTITAYLPFPGTDKLHKNQEDFEKPGSEIFWIDLKQRFNHPGPLDIEIKRCHVRSAGCLWCFFVIIYNWVLVNLTQEGENKFISKSQWMRTLYNCTCFKGSTELPPCQESHKTTNCH